MNRIVRAASKEEWRLAESLGPRRDRLLEVPPADLLLVSVIAEAKAAASQGQVRLRWQDCCMRQGFGRLHTELPLSEVTFDQFFNGRSGYRAQFFLSPEEGVLYNSDLMRGLGEAVEVAYTKYPPAQSLEFMLRSLAGPHSKVWVLDEQHEFDKADQDGLTPARWVESGAMLGRRAPLPADPKLDLKGAFIDPTSGALFVDDLKADRACDLHRKGYA